MCCVCCLRLLEYVWHFLEIGRKFWQKILAARVLASGGIKKQLRGRMKQTLVGRLAPSCKLEEPFTPVDYRPVITPGRWILLFALCSAPIKRVFPR
jgi:hypothetical protein